MPHVEDTQVLTPRARRAENRHGSLIKKRGASMTLPKMKKHFFAISLFLLISYELKAAEAQAASKPVLSSEHRDATFQKRNWYDLDSEACKEKHSTETLEQWAA